MTEQDIRKITEESDGSAIMALYYGIAIAVTSTFLLLIGFFVFVAQRVAKKTFNGGIFEVAPLLRKAASQ